jgi:hypothetical protein
MDAPLRDFDFTILDDPEFKEDAVREEIVAPLVRALGYAPSGRFRVVRSRPLEHPYVSIGSIKKSISIFPDYLLSVNDRLCWVLDAKAPSEPVDHPDHVSQAYSYAIHRDVRVEWFALCNGRELAVYNVADMSSQSRLRVHLRNLEECWDEVQALLRPTGAVATPDDYAKDFGIMMLRLGIPETTDNFFPGVPVLQLGRVEHSLYSLSARTEVEGGAYCVSFDFEKPLLEKLVSLFPPGNAEPLLRILEGPPGTAVNLEAQVPPMVTVVARRGTHLLENEKEHYLPLHVSDFRQFPPIRKAR